MPRPSPPPPTTTTTTTTTTPDHNNRLRCPWSQHFCCIESLHPPGHPVKTAALRDAIKGTLRFAHTASNITTQPNVKITSTTRLFITIAASFTHSQVAMFSAVRFGVTTD
jgi:hypothetical protein